MLSREKGGIRQSNACPSSLSILKVPLKKRFEINYSFNFLFLTYHMCPLGAWRDTCELYWKAGCSRDNTGSCNKTRDTGHVAQQLAHLTHHSPASHSLQGPGQREDPPVALPQLHRGLTQVLQPDAISPPVHVVLLILPVVTPQVTRVIHSYNSPLSRSVAHVEGYHRHPDVLCCLLVYI